MDEVKVKSTFSRMMLSKFLTKIISKKFGSDVEIYVNDLSIIKNDIEERYHIVADAEGYIPNKVVEDLICKKRSGSGTS